MSTLSPYTTLFRSVEKPRIINFAEAAENLKREKAEKETPLPPTDSPKPTDDPIRMYSSQMAELPLLPREEGIELAGKIEVSRLRFRRSVLGCDCAMRGAVDTLAKVHAGELRFDRTIKVSLTERLTKEQIQGRMPHNLKTLKRLLEENQRDFE